jgi:hypothetical protein
MALASGIERTNKACASAGEARIANTPKITGVSSRKRDFIAMTLNVQRLKPALEPPDYHLIFSSLD